MTGEVFKIMIIQERRIIFLFARMKKTLKMRKAFPILMRQWTATKRDMSSSRQGSIFESQERPPGSHGNPRKK